MTEKEKMLQQMMYDANYDAELAKERIQAKEMCYDYNMLRPSETDKQHELLKKLLGKTAENFLVVAPFWCDYGYNIEIGENFFANIPESVVGAFFVHKLQPWFTPPFSSVYHIIFLYGMVNLIFFPLYVILY